MHLTTFLFGAVAVLATVRVDAYSFDLDEDDDKNKLIDSDDDKIDYLDSKDDIKSGKSTNPYVDDTPDSIDLQSDPSQIVFLGADSVHPFPRTKARTSSQKSALMFQPQLYIEDGCHPYPAVQSNGSLNAGLEYELFRDPTCEGSPLGSQVYSRSSWYQMKWATIYTWYFPVAYDHASPFSTGHRHYWLWAIVWTTDPNPAEGHFLAVSMSGNFGISSYTLPHIKHLVNGTTVLLKSHKSLMSARLALDLTEKSGEKEDLITWEELTPEARAALSSVKRTEATANSPLQDNKFFSLLEKAYPW
ncbi:NLP-like protein [Plasmopara halstedii]|uniref:NLP-like protein n=1 Tax=Plasmopara halstedii TaxID=4781 RepID=A0A0P1ATB0_PLAHL|nr:NLP-like protein [Plasmopara halstedii]CEG44167.1 NLP-like protein [Plasmopara halstedii]|eukprot:XP_024580536.1 NLP-like protein [Plasmopara halstedii]